MFEQLNGTLALRENDTCFKYSENVEALKKVMADTVVSVKVIGKDFYFDGDKEERIILRVIILRKEKEISFRFGMSIADTETMESNPSIGEEIKFRGQWVKWPKIAAMRKEIKNGLLYDILSCIASDFFCPDTFHDFCAEFGYDEDSRKAEKTFHLCREQSRKLQTIFTSEEIESFPR